MVGQKGRSGGTRDGAGRKRDSCKSATFYCKKIKPSSSQRSLETFLLPGHTQKTCVTHEPADTATPSSTDVRRDTPDSCKEDAPVIESETRVTTDVGPSIAPGEDHSLDRISSDEMECVSDKRLPSRDWMLYSYEQHGWICSVCKSFSLQHKTGAPWLDIGAKLGDHPSRAVQRHETSSLHMNSLQNRQMYLTMHTRYSSVLDMMAANSDDLESNPSAKRRLLSVFVQIIFFLVKKHWAHTQNFEDIVKLMAKCGNKLLEQHLLFCKRNASWLSESSVRKYVAAISNHIESDLLSSIRSYKFYTLMLDETTDISSHNQMAIVCIFPHSSQITDHFMGIIDTTSHLPHHDAKSLKILTEKFLQQKGIETTNMRYLCTDTTNVMSGCRGGLRTLFQKDSAPYMLWIGCFNHLLALYFVHLSKTFKIIPSVDATLVALWKKFHFSSVATGYLVQVSKVYDESDVKPVKPSPTRWLSHGKACREFFSKQEIICTTLANLFHERNDYEAYGLLAQVTESDFLLTALLLDELLNGPIKHLTLILEKAAVNLSLTDVEHSLELTISQITDLIQGVASCDIFSKEKYVQVKRIADESILSIRRLRRTADENISDIFDKFRIDVAVPLLTALKTDIHESLVIPPQVKALSIIDPRHLPSRQDIKQESFQAKLHECIDTLVSHYGVDHPQCSADLSKADLLAESTQFFSWACFAKEKALEMYDVRVSCITDSEKRHDAMRKRNQEGYKVKDLYNDILADSTIAEQFPSFCHIVLLYQLLPFASSSVERVFSQLKLTKTYLRNRMSQTTLDQLLRITIEGPSGQFCDTAISQIVDEICKNPGMRL